MASDRFIKKHGPGKFHVANVFGSSVDKANWKDYWTTGASRGWPRNCSIMMCSNSADVTGHMYIRGGNEGSNYLLPICATHNKQSNLECANGRCPNWAETKKSSVLVEVKEADQVERFRRTKLIYRQSHDIKLPARVKSVTEIRSPKNSKEMQTLADCYVFFCMKECIYCVQLLPKFIAWANRYSTKHPCFLFHMEADEKYVDDLGVDEFPTVMHMKSGIIIEEVTNAIHRTKRSGTSSSSGGGGHEWGRGKALGKATLEPRPRDVKKSRTSSSSGGGGCGGSNKKCVVCGYSTGSTTYTACPAHRCGKRGCGEASGKARGENYSKYCESHQVRAGSNISGGGCGNKKCVVCGYSTGSTTYTACPAHRCDKRGCGEASGKARGENYSKYCESHRVRAMSPGSNSSGDVCGNMGGMAGMDFPQPQQAPKPPYYSIPRGTVVSMKGLRSRPERNGDWGIIQSCNVQTGRYTVQMGDSNEIMAVKPSNLLQHVNITIHGIESKPQLNGKSGTIIAWNIHTERYSMYVVDEAKAISLKPDNVILETGTVGQIFGLLSKPELNGQWGTIKEWDRNAARYNVQLSPDKIIGVKKGNIRV